MQFDELNALSPVDGRYRSKTEGLSSYFSEYALIRYRVLVEIEYLIALSRELPQLKTALQNTSEEGLRKIYLDFSLADAQAVKKIEETTNHDVKAVEYFIKEQFDKLGLTAAKEYIHFGLTSQDINNTAFPLMLKDAMQKVYIPVLKQIHSKLQSMSQEWRDVPMLAKTHGQPASPTKLGKEFEVYVYRLEQQYQALEAVPYTGKFGGATGNFNAHHIAYPSHRWEDFANRFLSSIGLEREAYTTQISNYDHLAAIFDALCRINTILIDLSRDIWMYISMEYFKQKIKAGEVGSSAMPHKVNPIDFENAEGNLGIADALLTHLARKLPISRLQRDLTDSTVIRNIGMPLGYGLIALKSLEKGLSKLLLNRAAIDADLERNYAVVAEAIQTVLRREGYPNPYETLKALTRTGEAISRESIAGFIDGLDVSEQVKEELRQITPFSYVGIY
ncbi:adenylosuccinate lyase [Porphyromonas crevioricanis]|uniref:Adenylosuccinate lyase n=2 Tax=Porphyromonas crevioricanis TaxID=393921 RepID=A0A0A2FMH2_9PORP|nr:adenylosuccinate lyase [Porphyromonas crevioricanis]KGN91240.1 adenylosuccinate lyase [Porphyromonas crevioricanis]KGN93058.1 adenylosuccinate lyase [Porphyromonas crevioricanis]SJZ84565.1 adenylosuccinate lyase [Porphyromonas crevioricanis]SQH73060.1 Adenylosuccinate lyase [Porphyromonas crevioricanis]GAD05142.1 adenylosuccinate lyase [Porphyromonas crevioricanis JCM 15906]